MGVQKLTTSIGFNGRNTLDREYNNLIHSSVLNNEKQFDRWLTYHQIFEELIYLNGEDKIGEVKYKLTSGENPIRVVLDLIDTVTEPTNYLLSLKYCVETYFYEDFKQRWF